MAWSKDATQALQVDGLVDLQRALRQIDATLPRQLRTVHKSIADRIAAKGQANAAALGPMEAAAAKAGLRARAEQRGAYIVLRATARAPFVMGAEFGAYQDKERRRAGGTYVGYRQFVAWTGNQHDPGAGGSDGGPGRFMYPAVRSEGQKIVDQYLEQLDALLRAVNQ